MRRKAKLEEIEEIQEQGEYANNTFHSFLHTFSGQSEF